MNPPGLTRGDYRRAVAATQHALRGDNIGILAIAAEAETEGRTTQLIAALARSLALGFAETTDAENKLAEIITSLATAEGEHK